MENSSFSINNIPLSVLPYPSGAWKRAKYIFWRGITSPFPYVRDALIKIHVLHHVGRQRFVLGTLASPEKLEAFLAHLQSLGFGNHFIAWKDEGEVVGVRRLDGFDYQYHLRIFKDGEIRGHYEFTPESHPIWHFKETGMEDRRDVFLAWIGDWIV